MRQTGGEDKEILSSGENLLGKRWGPASKAESGGINRSVTKKYRPKHQMEP
jgi:hypothetical protein